MKLHCISKKRRWSGSNFQFPIGRTEQRAYLLTEALVYIGLVVVLLGVAYAATYKFIDNSVALCRNADDISRALHAGERWRADIRSAGLGIRVETNATSQIIRIATLQAEISYTTGEWVVWRRIG